MGKPHCVTRNDSAQVESEPAEVKHLSKQRKKERSYSPSSGERKGN